MVKTDAGDHIEKTQRDFGSNQRFSSQKTFFQAHRHRNSCLPQGHVEQYLVDRSVSQTFGVLEDFKDGERRPALSRRRREEAEQIHRHAEEGDQYQDCLEDQTRKTLQHSHCHRMGHDHERDQTLLAQRSYPEGTVHGNCCLAEVAIETAAQNGIVKQHQSEAVHQLDNHAEDLSSSEVSLGAYNHVLGVRSPWAGTSCHSHLGREEAVQAGSEPEEDTEDSHHEDQAAGHENHSLASHEGP